MSRNLRRRALAQFRQVSERPGPVRRRPGGRAGRAALARSPRSGC